MSQPFVGEIRCFAFQFAPVNWAFCNGQSMAIANNTTLFTLIGTTYGGDGQTTFNLPNLQGNVPMHWGTDSVTGLTNVIGQTQGQTQVTLSLAQTPSHSHTVVAGIVPAGGIVERTPTPTANTYMADASPGGLYAHTPSSITTAFSSRTLNSVGGSQPHDNMQPYLAVNFCIALFGVFPSRN